MNNSILFEDIFEVKTLNENGKKFERGEDIRAIRERMLTNLLLNHTMYSKSAPLQGDNI